MKNTEASPSSGGVTDHIECHSSLVQLLRTQAERFGSRTAYTLIQDGPAEASSRNLGLTYGELSYQASVIGARLQQMKLRGERAILLYPPGLDYLAAFHGCMYAGVIAIPAFPPRPNRKNERLTAIIDDAGPAVALTVAAARRRIGAYLSLTYGKAAPPVESTDDIPDGPVMELEEFCPGPEDLAYLQYTSGSTASPKGVMITHRNVLSNLAYIDEGFEHSSESVSLTWLPHFHDMGLVDGLLMPLYRGFRGLLMTPAQFLQRPILWLELISKYRVTHSGGPNFAYDLCVRKMTGDQRSRLIDRGLDLGSWQVAYNGAEPVRREVLDRFAETFAPFGFNRSAFYPAYGLAEATLKVSGGRRGVPPVYCPVASEALERNIVSTARDTKNARQLVSCGGVGAGTEVVIVDPESGSECGPDSVGEIWVSGPGVAKGFWNRPEESTQVFRAFTSDTRKGPYLRTGDLGFYRDGGLYVTGRLKDLIIIRGRNIYPQDIESTAGQSHPSLRPGGGAAFAIDDGRDERVVVVHEIETRKAFEDSDNCGGIIAAIRQAVSETYEIQLSCVLLIKAGGLPRTSSGKAQRMVCRRNFLEGQLDPVAEWSLDESSTDDKSEAPTEDEARDAACVMREAIAARLALAPDAISLDEPLSRYGLDSLASMEIAHEIETRLGTPIPMADLLADRSINELAAEIAFSEGIGVVSLSEAGGRSGEMEYPLSRGQQAIWFIYQMDPLNAAYNMAGAVSINSSLNIESLRRSFQALVDRHEALRTTFRTVNGIVRQRAGSATEVCFSLRDASEWSRDVLNDQVAEEASRPFDLENGPVFRVTLYRRAADLYVLLIAVHHIVADFWSLSILMSELGKLYRRYESGTPHDTHDLPDLTASYADYVARQELMLASAEGQAHWSYWSGELQGDLPLLALRLDKQRPRTQTYRGESVPFAIRAGLTAKAKSLSKTGHATLFVTLLTAFEVLLSKYCGQEETLIGTPTAGRVSAGLAGLVGYFVNPVVIRSIINPFDSFSARVAQTRQSVIGAFRHQEYPFADIVKRLNAGGDPSRSPLFQAMFAFQTPRMDPEGRLAAISLGASHATFTTGDLELQGFPIQQRIAQFDITLTVAECCDEVQASLEYNTGLFERSTIERMGTHFLTLLDRAVANPLALVSTISYTTCHEQDQLLGWGDSSSKLFAFVPIHQAVERHATSSPDSVAVITASVDDHEDDAGDGFLTYGELGSRSGKLRTCLRSAGVGLETPVALLLHRSVDMVVALMAVLKSGGAYVPMDPQTPVSRVKTILRDVGPAVVLTHSSLANLLGSQQIKTLYLDRDWEALENNTSTTASRDAGRDGGADLAEAVHGQIAADSVCYIIYTSGSTGTPKGVAVRHFSLAQYIDAASSHYGLVRDDRLLQFASLSFDASADEIFSTLTSGATLVVPADPAAMSTIGLVDFCRERMITVLSLPTAYWHAAVSSLSPKDWSRANSVRLAVIGGEAALPEKLDQWIKGEGARVPLVNAYGPTETTIGVTFWSPAGKKHGDSSRVLIGQPIAGSSIRILDIHGQPSAAGVIGEICIGGAGLARGYWNDAAKTAESFVPDAFTESHGLRVYRSGDLGCFVGDGNIECLGRLDRQVKVRGYRIEPREVETALSRFPGVKEAAVAAVDDGRGNRRLAAYVVSQEGADRHPDLLKDALRQVLPPFMVPSHFVFLEALPRNTSGKIDSRLLPSVLSEPRLVGTIETRLKPGVEQQIAEVWSRVLGVRIVGRDDNFFELGGDSIVSLQVVAMARDRGILITPKQIFENPTVPGLAAVASVTQAHPPQRAPRGEPIPLMGPPPLTPIQRWFFERNFENPNHWNMALMLELKDTLSFYTISSAFSGLIAGHPVLRSTFILEDGEWRQRAGSGLAPIIREVDLTSLSPSEELEAVSSTTAIEQAGLDISAGPLMTSVLFRTDAGKRDRLLIVAHHLITDAISLRVMVEDLDRGCSGVTIGAHSWGVPTPADSVHRTAEVGLWAAELERLAADDSLRPEFDYWQRLMDAGIAALPVDFAGANLEGTSETVETRLDLTRTAELIRVVRETHRGSVEEVLLGAAAQALCDWTGAEAALIEVERHGREAVGIGLDVSRSIGWFTAAFPQLIKRGTGSKRPVALKRGGSTENHLPESVTGQDRRNSGISFGVLRYLSGDPKVKARMSALPQAQVSFNYLGNLDAAFGGLRFFDSPKIPREGSRPATAERTHLIELDAAIKDKGLEVHWRFSSRVFKRETIERLSDALVAQLVWLIERSGTEEAVSYSISDYPLATISQPELDRLTRSHPQIRNIYPLSPSQQGMLFHAVYSGTEDVYVGTLFLSVDGKLDPGSFDEAWGYVLRRHSIFRTSFVWEELSEPIQIVQDRVPNSITRRDWSDLPEQSEPGRLEELATQERLRGFDLRVAPLIRLTLIRLSNERYLLALTLHHLLMDGWSLSLFFQELFTTYDRILRAAEPLETGPEQNRAPSFDSYIGWLQRQDAHAAETFWREELRGVTGLEPLPIRSALPLSPDHGTSSRRRIRLTALLTSRLVSFARQNWLTLNTVIQGAWGALLARYSGQTDLLFGAVTAGRPPALTESERVIGPFSVTLPARTLLSPESRLGDWLKDFQHRQIEARRFEYCSLVDIQGWSEVPRGQPLFDSVIAFENYPLDRASIGSASGLRIGLIESLESTNYPLTVVVFPGDHLTVEILYKSNQFADSSIERLLGHFETLITGFIDSWTRPVSTVSILTAAERTQLLGSWSGHATGYPNDKSIAALFREQVYRRPDSVAVVYDRDQVSYVELYRRAETAASGLALRGVGPEIVVAVSAERSMETITSMLAIVQSGAAYLPVDLSYPADRLRFILADCGANVVLSSTAIREFEDSGIDPLTLKGLLEEAAPLSEGDDQCRRSGEPPSGAGNLAYVMYTSGSTGSPKGVGVTNRGVVRLVKQTNYFDFGEEEVFLQSSPLTFDASTFEIWGALLNGARLVLMPPETPSLAQIGTVLKEHQVTAAWFTAGLFHLLAQDRIEDLFTNVKHILAGGDVVSVEDARILAARAPRCRLTNGYGPTESTTFAACYGTEAGAGDCASLPIGRPVSNTFIHIVDQDLNAVPDGFPGEIHIGGDGLARGYIGAPGSTAERFCPNPFSNHIGLRLYRSGDTARFLPDGNIEFLGRRDHQLKIRGFRVEPGETESVLANCPKVKQCAIVACGQGTADKRLVAYLAGHSGQG
ncbi:MAG TPA: amino acid adenylation domain-containing protein, partial [Blastocatellia bacterium]|nr:amino acid adenylation domain-containing protein [Blastocatellia bacterium]